MEVKAPWTLAKEGRREELDRFLYGLSELLKAIALLLWPFMPTTAQSIWRQLGFDSDLGGQKLALALEEPMPVGQSIRKGKPLFPRIEQVEAS